MDTYFTLVEEVLSSFPLECRKNYYENKNSLKINIEDSISDKIYGDYDHYKNIITLYRIEALPHELFHMAFRDGKKVNRKIYDDCDMVYGNGVSFSTYCNEKKIIMAKGFTEGFAEYLSRKCSICEGKTYQYYFVDLLVSIYGEEIVEYPLRNDSVGFFADSRFLDISKINIALDKLDTACSGIILVSTFRDTINDVFKDGSVDDKTTFSKLIVSVRTDFKDSIVELFKLMIDEYNHCKCPKISKEEFYQKMNMFLTDSRYSPAFVLDDKYFCVKDELNSIFKKFYRKNRLLRRRVKK